MVVSGAIKTLLTARYLAAGGAAARYSYTSKSQKGQHLLSGHTITWDGTVTMSTRTFILMTINSQNNYVLQPYAHQIQANTPLIISHFTSQGDQDLHAACRS